MQLKYEKTSKQSLLKTKVKHFVKHPYFPILLLGALLLLLELIGSTGAIKPSVLNFLSPVLIRYIVALGFMLLLGYTGLASLGTAGFMGLGAYLIGYLFQTVGISAEIGFLLGLVVSLMLGTIVGFISLRIEGMYLAIVTLGLSEILRNLYQNASFTGGSNGMNLTEGITFFGILSSNSLTYNHMFYVIVVFMVIMMIWTINIINSPTGRALLSIKNSTSAAQAMGISILKYRLTAFLLATLFAVTGGMLQMVRSLTSYPQNWGLDLSLNILAAVVIGGTKNIWGLLVGIFIVFGLKDLVLSRISFFQTYSNAYLMFSGALIIVVVMFYPGGVIKLFKDLKNLVVKAYQKLVLIWKEYRYGKDI